MSDNPTKLKILKAAETLMLEKGFHAVGLNEILSAVNVPKGSFYHHFKSKEQFGVELLEFYVAEALEYKTKMLLSPVPEPDPYQRLLTFLETGIAKCCENDGKCPCLSVKLSSEVSGYSPAMREVLAKGSVQTTTIIAEVIREGIEAGTIANRVDPAIMATVILDLWTGATQRAATLCNTAPFRSALQFIKQMLSP